jgi:hypothetical protein
MIVLPVETTGNAHDSLLIVLGDDNIGRMKKADPVQIELKQLGRTLVNPTLCIAYENLWKGEPTGVLKGLIETGDLSSIAEFVTRGFKYKPEAGDHDRGPERLGKPRPVTGELIDFGPNPMAKNAAPEVATPKKTFEQMDPAERAGYMTALARAIEDALPPGEGPRGKAMFVLVVSGTQEGGEAHYASNVVREDAIPFMREFADRLEKRETY